MDRFERIDVCGLSYAAGPLAAEKWGSDEHGVLVTLRSSDGAEGRSLVRCHLGTSFRTLAEYFVGPVAERILGGEVRRGTVEEVWRTLLRLYQAQYMPLWPLSAVDVAAWDLLGQARGQPVRRLLSDTATESVLAYSSIPRYDDAQAGIADAVETRHMGYRAIKVHTCGNVSVDISLTEGVARALDEPGTVAFDGSKRLSQTEARRIAEMLGDVDGLWLEEPFDPYDRRMHAELVAASDVPIFGFETAPGGPEAAAWAVEHGNMEGVLIDCNWKAGISGAVETVRVVRAAGGQVVMHHGGSSTMNMANMQLVAALADVGMVELLTPVDEYNKGQVVPRPGQSGRVELNSLPGLGQVWDEEWLAAHEIVHSRDHRTTASVHPVPGRGNF